MKVFIAVLLACVFCLTIEALKDKRKDCAKYEKKGKCNVKSGKWKRWMDNNCELTCARVQHLKHTWCVDKKTSCKKYKKNCDSKRMDWKTWMNRNCRKTCGCHQPIKECGIQQHEKPVKKFRTFGANSGDRIVGGKDAKRGELPWQVGIWYTKEVEKEYSDKSLKIPFCGGTLISPNVVVTAAHCFLEKTSRTGTSPNKYYVMVGDLNATKEEDHQKKVVVEKIITHKQFNDVTYSDDIALLILKDNVAFSKDVLPICIPDQDTFPPPKKCSISGWGDTSEKGNPATHLQVVSLPTVPRNKCNKVYENIYKKEPKPVISDKMVCAGYDEGKKDACQGDSGGPMSCPYSNNGQKRYYLDGIVSFGHGCARAKSYGVYANAYKYINWIREQLEYKFF